MSEEFDLSDALEKAKTTTTKAKKSKKNRTRWIITGALAVAVVGAFAFNLQNWFKPDDFNQDIPLSQNITKWSSLSWGSSGNFEGDNLDTPTGDWKIDNETGIFTNPEWEGCTIFFTKTVGDYGDNANDYDDTMKYKGLFSDGQEDSQTKNVWIPLEGYDTKGIEVLKTQYIDSEGNNSVAYYRHSPLNKTVFFGTVRCETPEELEKLVPWEQNGSEITDLGIWLKS